MCGLQNKLYTVVQLSEHTVLKNTSVGQMFVDLCLNLRYLFQGQAYDSFYDVQYIPYIMYTVCYAIYNAFMKHIGSLDRFFNCSNPTLLTIFLNIYK